MDRYAASADSKRRMPRWLLLVVVVFAGSALFSVHQLQQGINLLNQSYGSSIWSLFQLKNEWRRFDDYLRLYQYRIISRDELLLSYDLLWSRFPILLEGQDGRQLADIERGRQTIEEAFAALRSVEGRVIALRPSQPDAVHAIKARLEPHYPSVHELALRNFHQNNEFFDHNDRHLLNLQTQLGFSLLGVLVSGGCLLLMVLRENRRNRHQALHDSLTAMPNRTYLRQWLNELCDGDTSFALHLLDLNGFKEVNDTLGHHAGDRLLQMVADRLQQSQVQRQGFKVARLGGDEFAVLQYPVGRGDQARQAAQRIIDALAPAFEVEGHPFYIGGSIGTVLYPEHGSRTQDLLSRADMAMYEAKKQAPESACCFFRREMNQALKRRQRLHRDLRDALQRDELWLEYQPIVDMTSGRLHGLEALLRWQHPDLGMVPPPEIIEVAEQYGLGMQLGSWVVHQACRQNRIWQRQGLVSSRVSVNISPSMYRSELVDLIAQALSESELAAECLAIEVTEDTTMQVLQNSMDILPQLHRMGIDIALDDFGTGLSSLSHLKDLPVQTLKIDRSFVKDIGRDEHATRLVESMVQLGHNLGMRVVAEGIEDEAVLQLLRQQRCDYGQGYLYSKPLPAGDVPAVIMRLAGVGEAEVKAGSA
ncbi:putative bifunctional diguanylate cyclase/phosphodiesterase [Marinobacterium arenosum]|uniref:putative bifunctional diguanylate cyclase/phosphodiesterase n=1 Tax=Marinobacterium arenosum TaxID=2862496 RepID=UPI001C940170|nr:GGDEF domain-containing phosphodiesterase [Marinobacterium arenosum]MBY4678044.1 EAL domain-containing protein [Marinobacterium arenosum]